MPSPPRCRALAAALMVAATLVLGSAATAGAAGGGCDAAATKLRDDIEALVPASGPPAEGTAAADKIRTEARALYSTALKQHPTCTTAFAKITAQLGATTPPAEGTPFLGPIGWLWNTVYYDIFQGDTVLMAMFGWELLLAPVILLACAVAVFHGTKGLLKKPYVPPELRTNET